VWYFNMIFRYTGRVFFFPAKCCIFATGPLFCEPPFSCFQRKKEIAAAGAGRGFFPGAKIKRTDPGKKRERLFRYMLIWRALFLRFIHRGSCLVQICSYVVFPHSFFRVNEENMASRPDTALVPLRKRGRQKPGGS
jgi:hypothetical protein